jgi:hypothetical protein
MLHWYQWQSALDAVHIPTTLVTRRVSGGVEYNDQHRIYNVSAVANVPQHANPPSILIKDAATLTADDEALLKFLLCVFRAWPDNFAWLGDAPWQSRGRFSSPAAPQASDRLIYADIAYDGKWIYFQTWVDNKTGFRVRCQIGMDWWRSLFAAGLLAYPMPVPSVQDHHAVQHHRTASHFFDVICILSMAIRSDSQIVNALDNITKTKLWYMNRCIKKKLPDGTPAINSFDIGYYVAWKMAEYLLCENRWSWSDQHSSFSPTRGLQGFNVEFAPVDHTAGVVVSIPDILLAKGRMIEDGSTVRARVPALQQETGHASETPHQGTPSEDNITHNDKGCVSLRLPTS